MDPDVGFVTQTWMDPATAIEWAGERGFDFVEVLLDGDAHRERIDPTALAAAADGAGVDLAVHLPFPLDVGSPHERLRAGAVAEHEACIDAAAAAGAGKAVLHPESAAWGAVWDDAAVRPHVLESVDHLAEFAAERGVEICAENLFENPFTIHEMDRLLAATGASMTLDTGHARIAGADEAAVAGFLAEHGDRVTHLHLNDTRGPEDEHLPFGAGTIDFTTEFDALPEGWDGTMSIETFGGDYDYLATSQDRLAEVLASV